MRLFQIFLRCAPMVVCIAVGMRGMAAATHGVVAEDSSARTIDEVVVTGTRTPTDVRLLPMTVSVVDRTTIEASHRASLLPTLTEHVPGLFVTGRGIMGYGVSTGAAGTMTMRGIGVGTQGGPTTGMLVLIDGHPQYMGLMGHPIADAYQSMLADRVEVVRGPASVLYGSNAMGGVMNIVTRKMPQDGVRTNLDVGYGSYNTVHTEASNCVKSGRFTSIAAASYDRTDGHRPNMGFEQYGGYWKGGWRIGRTWSVAGDVGVTHFNASNPGTVAAPLIDNDSRITRGAASILLQNDYRRASGALSVFYNWGLHNIDDGYAQGAQPLDYRFYSRDYMSGVSWYESAQLFEGNRTTVGVDWQHFGGKAWNHYFSTDENHTSADRTMNEGAAYVDFRQQLGRTVTLDAGVRFDRNAHVGGEWIPQGGLSLRLSSSASLKARVSKGFRFPTIREMYMFPPQNPDLKSEKLLSNELSYSQQLLGGALSCCINLFYINGSNMIVRDMVGGRPKYVNTGRVRNWGAEGEAIWRISAHWSVEANYSWLHMRYPLLSAPEHKLFGEVRYGAERWTAQTSVMYVSGLYTATTPLTKETFALWNVDLNFRLCREAELYVKGENLLGRRYEINLGFPMPRATVMGGCQLHF